MGLGGPDQGHQTHLHRLILVTILILHATLSVLVALTHPVILILLRITPPIVAPINTIPTSMLSTLLLLKTFVNPSPDPTLARPMVKSLLLLMSLIIEELLQDLMATV